MYRDNPPYAWLLSISHWTFVPNKNFWLLMLMLAGMGGWMVLGEWRQQRRFHDQLSVGGEVVPTEPESIVLQAAGHSLSVSLFSPSVAVSVGVLLSLSLKLLLQYLVRQNKLILLSDENSGELSVYVGNRYLPFRFGWRFWGSVGLSFVGLMFSWQQLQASNQEVKVIIGQLREEVARQKEIEERERMDESQAILDSKRYKQDVIGYFIDHLQHNKAEESEVQRNYREAFIVQKQLIISQYLIKYRVSRVDQLGNKALLKMNREIAQLFEELILSQQRLPRHVEEYFTDTTDLDKLETALMEQAKYHVPASIKLAQAALETAYGQRVIGNNYFGIKRKRGGGKEVVMETTEYYTAKELALNAHKVLSKEKVEKGGRMLYKCRIKDRFQAYNTPWASFRAHSVFLSENERYHALFTGGKDYRAWADRIGSTKYGGVGYATSPIYGSLLKKIIRRYHLDLLDQ